MKARVKATGEIIDGKAMVSFNGDDFYLDELEVIEDDTEKTLYDELDEVYWANMKHQYAGMAMQGMLANPDLLEVVTEKKGLTKKEYADKVACIADIYAAALVEKLKEK